MEQYLEIKEHHKDQILFFRLGDFYEMFFDDAVIASRELELTLTGKNCGMDERAKMCGVPYHSCEAYIARLIKKGYKVTILERNFIKDVKFAVTVTDDNDKKSDVTVKPEFKLVMDGDKPKVTVNNDIEFYTYEWESKFANDGDYTFSISAIV